MKNETMMNFLKMLVKDFNSYSELVALNYSKKKEGECDEGVLQWNRGGLNKIEEYMKQMADELGVTLTYECKEHNFGYDNWQRVLEYRTVMIGQ